MKANTLSALSLALLTLTAAGCNQVEVIGVDYGSGDEWQDDDGDDQGAESGDADGGENGDGDGDGDGDDGRNPGDGDGDGDDGRNPGDGDGDGDGDLTCDPVEMDLVAGQHTNSGSVIVYMTEDNLVIELEASQPWMMGAAHAYAGTEQVEGKAPGQYPHKVEFDAPVDSHAFEIPREELDLVCGDVLSIAVHAEMLRFEDGEPVQEETAWAQGPHEFDNAWGWHFEYEVCCDASVQ